MKKQKDDVYAVEGGVVLYALKTPSDYGIRIYIRHSDGSTAMYGHLEEIKVKPKQVIDEGECIATIGGTGNCPSGKHLHVNYFAKNSASLTGKDSVDPTFWIQLHAYPTNTICTGGYAQVYEDANGNEYLHEGIDFSFLYTIAGWENGIDALYQDYKKQKRKR